MITSPEKAKNTRSMVDRFAEFMNTPLYANYWECLNLEREAILLDGKKTRDPHILSKLEGFDQAASFFQRQYDSIKRKQINDEDHYEPEY